MKNWYQIAAKGEQVTEVYLYDEIGLYGIDAAQFIKDFSAIKTPKITLRINSPGGSVFDGLAIYSAISRHESKVTAYIDGLAASMASVVPLAADRVVMASTAFYMIHDPWTFAAGNSRDLREIAEILDKLQGSLASVYTGRGVDEATVLAAMAAETWYNASEALELGFVDEVDEVAAVAACVTGLDRFKNVPSALRASAPRSGHELVSLKKMRLALAEKA